MSNLRRLVESLLPARGKPRRHRGTRSPKIDVQSIAKLQPKQPERER